MDHIKTSSTFKPFLKILVHLEQIEIYFQENLVKDSILLISDNEKFLMGGLSGYTFYSLIDGSRHSAI